MFLRINKIELMNNIKSLIDSVIVDLSENKSIEAILLKVQTISFYLKDDDFSSWIKHEQNGYGNDTYPLPDYRKVNCVVKIDVSQYGSMAKNMMFPCEVINDDKICERLTHMPVYESLNEIEQMTSNKNAGNDLIMAVPWNLVQNHFATFVNGNILVANQHINMSTIQAVVSQFKSKLLAFFLELNENMDWSIDFDALANKNVIKQIMVTNNINAAVVATDGSSITVGDVKVENSQIGNVTYSDKQQEFLSLLDEIDKLICNVTNNDLKDSLELVKVESNKQSWNKKLMSMGLNAMKGVANGFVVEGLMELVDKGIEFSYVFIGCAVASANEERRVAA